MARVTVEDCVIKVPNRFDLVMLAAQRARDISAGAQLAVDRDNDKDPVVALREIADEAVALGELEESLVKRLQKHVERDEPGEEEMDLAAIQQDMGIMVGAELAVAAGVADDDLDVEADEDEGDPDALAAEGELDQDVIFQDISPDEIKEE